MSRLLIVWILLLGFHWAVAKPIPVDSSKIVLRVPSTEQINTYRNNPEYFYGNDVTENISYWSELWLRFTEWVNSFFNDEAYGSTRQALAYLFVALMLVFVILKMIGIDFTSLFVKKPTESAIFHELLSENIEGVNFDLLIQRATNDRDFRFAVRLYYLKTLQQLSNKGLISWKLNKTNRSYMYEVQPQYRPSFEYLTRQFEYVWYGDFTVKDPYFAQLKTDFDSFIAKL